MKTLHPNNTESSPNALLRTEGKERSVQNRNVYEHTREGDSSPLAGTMHRSDTGLCHGSSILKDSNIGMNFHRTGILFVISAPSGAGKTTLCTALRHKPDFVYSVSCTTRAPRPGEIEGEDYYFLTRKTFAEKIASNDFLEHAEVHGHFYGTLKEPVLEQLQRGIDVLIDIDTRGAAAIRANPDRTIQDALADVFIMPPDLEELRRRLERRGTENAQEVELRLANAAREMECWHDYRYTIISGSMEENIEKFRAIMRAERYRSRRFFVATESQK